MLHAPDPNRRGILPEGIAPILDLLHEGDRFVLHFGGPLSNRLEVEPVDGLREECGDARRREQRASSQDPLSHPRLLEHTAVALPPEDWKSPRLNSSH